MSKVVSNVFQLGLPSGRMLPGNVNRIFVRYITRKSMREDTKKKPKPFPYTKERYYYWRSVYDRTYKRFDENSKLIVVEGPVASGKTALAKKLAEELDFLHVPEPTMDVHYINNQGYDMRQLDELLPLSVRSFDEKNFCQEPFHRNVAQFQFNKRRIRYSIYHDCLEHIFQTGQGVVTERSPYTDPVFTHSMHDVGMISPGVKSMYDQTWLYAKPWIKKPHLIIYLDVPVPQVLKNIQKRDLPYERNSPALTEKFLKRMEYYYKQDLLKDLGTHAKLLMYDWAEGGDVNVVLEDIERIPDFDIPRSWADKCLHDWNMERWEMDEFRWKLSRHKARNMISFGVVERHDVPELMVDGNDMWVYEKMWMKAPGMKFADGYDPMVDRNILWKWKQYERYNNQQ